MSKKQAKETDSWIFVYRHPLDGVVDDEDTFEERDLGVEDAKTLAELRMIHLSWAIRQKKGWQSKLKRKAVVEEWRREAFLSQENAPKESRLTENMINYVFTELQAYARLTDQHGIQHACNDATFCSYSLISEEISREFLTGIRVLENVPEDQKDWHPGSNAQVLDLVHPSLYCLVYGQTLSYRGGSLRVFSPHPLAESRYFSDLHAWLPSEFKVGESGEVHLISPYINNLHRSHRDLYSSIPKILASFIPMFERVLGAIAETHHVTLETAAHSNVGQITGTSTSPIPENHVLSGRIPSGDPANLHCIWDNYPAGIPYDQVAYDDEFHGFPGGTFDDRYYAWQRSQNIRLPEAYAQYQGALEANFRVANLRGRVIQCIVKLANIELTPDRSEYPGGNWHVEGMLNEHIVATGIYYYDSENISESKLDFRTSIHQVPYHQQDDVLCMRVLYGLNSEDALVQERGSISTFAGLALAFPNLYQHRVSPFHLADSTKPGHRKILAFFLVDPNTSIPSTSTVPPQQEHWMAEFMHNLSSSGIGGTYLEKIPSELRDIIVAKTPGLMNRKQADEVRVALMEERSRLVDTYNEEVMQQEFNMCEH